MRSGDWVGGDRDGVRGMGWEIEGGVCIGEYEWVEGGFVIRNG